MPLYEYDCECGKQKEILLSMQEGSQPQVCVCGKEMRRKMSVPRPAIFKPTGHGMALDDLNSKTNGFPNRHWKAGAEQKAASGI